MSDNQLKDTLSLFTQDKTPGKKGSTTTEGEKKATAYWIKCLEIIKDNVSPHIFNTWFEPIKALKWENKQLTVKVPSQFFCEWIEDQYYSLLQKTISQVLGEDAKLLYQIVVDESDSTTDKRTIKLPAFKFPPQPVHGGFAENHTEKRVFTSNLNPKYTFNNFVRGESNQLAYAAGLAISQNPGKTRYNPLVVYGDSGLGKTHLVQGIGNKILQNHKKSKVLYTTSERFTQDFINAIQNNRQNEFINLYRSIDTLIVDDIQFFCGKEKTTDNFFHTFNALHQDGKQLILTSDRPPRDLKDLDERLISRFQWGLIVDIQPPDLEMRMAILQKKSVDEGIELPIEIVEYIAKYVTNSIRELEGTLISLIAKYTFENKSLNLALAKEVVNGISKREPKPVTIDDIKELVAGYYKMPVESLESQSRKHEIALARQMAIYLTKQFTQLSLKSIGAGFSNRDHSTILHSCQTIENYLVTDPSVKSAYEHLHKTLKSK
ncbi:MAG: chromosomal replication initiator protein DnaA [Ignavibacteriae bacterium]|nr:chromosomal replication initiator protein DnaA [Ignavibacteriota bacterium]